MTFVSSAAKIVPVVESLLGHPLEPEDRRTILLLSPQGIAKLNFDICKAIPMADTLRDLRLVFHTVELRRKHVLATMNDSGRRVVEAMERPASANEMVFLTKTPLSSFRKMICDRLRAGESLEDAVEDATAEAQMDDFAMEAQLLAADMEGPVLVKTLRLAPTRRGPCCKTISAMFPYTTIRRGERMWVAPSAISSWFHEPAFESRLDALMARNEPGCPEAAPEDKPVADKNELDVTIDGFPTNDDGERSACEGMMKNQPPQSAATASVTVRPRKVVTFALSVADAHEENIDAGHRVDKDRPVTDADDDHHFCSPPFSPPPPPTSQTRNEKKRLGSFNRWRKTSTVTPDPTTIGSSLPTKQSTANKIQRVHYNPHSCGKPLRRRAALLASASRASPHQRLLSLLKHKTVQAFSRVRNWKI